MGDEPTLRGSGGEDYPEAAELLLEEEEDGSWRRRIVIIIIIILILLLLLWPVDQSKLRSENERGRREAAGLQARRPAGRAKYELISGGPRKDLMRETRKGVAVEVWFYVENISRRSEVLDFSMVNLIDQFGMEYAAAVKMTEQEYKRQDMLSPWEQEIEPGEKVKALVLFKVFAGPKKEYLLVGRDFEWTSDKTKELKIGAFDTLPGRMYMPPD